MTTNEQLEEIRGFDEVDRVIANPEKFKIKLGMGADTFASLRTAKAAGQLWGIGTAAGSGAAVAGSSAIASTFFGTFWTAVGIGTAATPIGWVAGAAILGGGAYYGVARLFRGYQGSRTEEVPKFLNSGLDVLATSVLDLLGSLAIKLADIDGSVDQSEREAILDYFRDEWGYDERYLAHAMQVLEHNKDRMRLTDMVEQLGEFSRTQPDIKFSSIQNEVRLMLTEIAEADGRVDEREEMAIERVTQAFASKSSVFSSAGNLVADSAASVGSFAGRIFGKKQ